MELQYRILDCRLPVYKHWAEPRKRQNLAKIQSRQENFAIRFYQSIRDGKDLPSDIYFIHLKTQNQKVLVVKEAR
ncbi:MAG: hypothetical protein ABIK93_06415 [candidate division WOR-3 bacterium]